LLFLSSLINTCRNILRQPRWYIEKIVPQQHAKHT